MQLELWQILILAAVQGITEFLPISSSGHLVILAHLIVAGDAEQLDVVDVSIVLHVGTLLSIAVFYFRRITRLLAQDRRVLWLLVLGTLPAVAVGLPLELLGDQLTIPGSGADQPLLSSPLLAGLLLPVTGLILLLSARRASGRDEYTEIGWRRALLVGSAQAAAILPGLSRSGTTIACGMSLRMSPQSATTFSFLLALPVIAGAGVLKILMLLKEPTALITPPTFLALGMLVSFLVGLVALWWLVRWVERGRLQWFAWWCIPVGIAVVAWQLLA